MQWQSISGEAVGYPEVLPFSLPFVGSGVRVDAHVRACTRR